MNYFELFEIPIGFDIDRAALTKQFYVLSKQYHPDKFSLNNTKEQLAAETKSAEINQAYKVLKNKDTRLKYILDLLDQGLGSAKENLPQEFLMEMMEINEAIMDYKMDPTTEAKANIEKSVTLFQSDLNADIQVHMDSLDFSDPDAAHVSSIKTYYLKSKYLKRIVDLMEDKGVEM